MSDRLSEWFSSVSWFYVSLAALVGLGLLIIFLWPEERPIAVAHALIIAGILGLFVDRFVKAHFIREVTKDVYHFLIGYDLPTEIKENIKELMRTKIVRSNFRVDYRFQKKDSELLSAEVTLDYDLENFSNHPEPFTPELAVENIDRPTFHSVTFTGPGEYHMEGNQLRPRAPEEGSLQVDGKKVKILPRDEGVHYHVRFRYAIVVPHNYSDAWAFGHPTTDVSFTAEIPEGFAFHVSGAKKVGNTWKVDNPRKGARVRCFVTAPDRPSLLSSTE